MKIILSILASLIFTASYGQSFSVMCAVDLDKYDKLDSVRLSLTYKLTYSQNPQKPDVKSTDMQILEIGDKVSKYYSRYLIDYAKYTDELIKSGQAHDGIPQNPQGGTRPYEIYKDYPSKGKLNLIDISDIFSLTESSTGYLYTYEEPVPAFVWQLKNEFITILGYRCQKATTTFRGRDYTAWFTTKIPMSNGPWKFSGLPGLIMKVTDSENHYDFECIGMEQPKGAVIKLYNDKKYVPISRKDYMKLYQRMHDNPVGFYESLGIRVMVGDGRNNYVPPEPYNPIERE